MVIVFSIAFVVLDVVKMRKEVHKDGGEMYAAILHATTCFHLSCWAQPEGNGMHSSSTFAVDLPA